MGPNEEIGYIICYPVSGGTRPSPDGNIANIGFKRSQVKTEESFVSMSNAFAAGQATFTTGTQAYVWLNANGYWTSYIPLTPTPTSTSEPTSTPTSTEVPVTPTPSSTSEITPTPTQTPTVTSTNSGSLRVLFLGDLNASTIASNISTYISATGYSINYSAVTMGTTYTGSGNITPANYDVVVIWTNASQTGSSTLSSAMTSYVNAGGSVVSGVFLWNLYASGYNHSGTTAFNATNSQSNIASPASFTVSTPSVITDGIGTSFGEFVLTNSNPTLSTGASLLASYNSGSVRLLAVKEVGSSKLVSVNTSFSNINTSGETLTKMVGNSILYAGGRLVQPTPTPTPTNTQTPEPTITPTTSSTSEPTPTPSLTPEPTASPTNTQTPEPTVTPTPSSTSEITPTPSETPTNTPTPSVTPEPVTGYSFNLIALPYNYPTSGNTILNNPPTNLSGSTDPNLLETSTRGLFWNITDSDGIDRSSYFLQFTGQSITITMSQIGSTAIYSGDTNSLKYWTGNTGTPPGTPGSGFVFGTGVGTPSQPPSGTAVLIQSASTQWTIGLPVYISAVINGGTTPTPTPTQTSTPTLTPTLTQTPEPTITPTSTEVPVTPTPSSTSEPTPTPSSTSEPTPTPSSTSEPTPTPSSTSEPTPTPSSTSEPTPTPSSTSIPSCDITGNVIDPTPTPTPTNTVTPTNTLTPTITPTITPTSSPVWRFIIENSNTTRSVTDANINGVTQTLEEGSYPILNSFGLSTTHGTVTTGINPDVLQFVFGGSGFFNTFQVFKNGVLQFDLPGYASNTMTCGGMTIASNDIIKAVFT
jgi:hypothetical protein